MATVHLHKRGGPVEEGCRVECGLPCGDRSTTAYRNLDPERVTCPTCLGHLRYGLSS